VKFEEDSIVLFLGNFVDINSPFVEVSLENAQGEISVPISNH
jgi:hypothetical protein